MVLFDMNQKLNNVKENIITFDVFDTLVIRNVVRPIDVFDMVGGKHFRYTRIIAELVARKISKNEDVTLDEIYHFLPKKFKEKEIAIEKDICKPNPPIYEIYKNFKVQGKKIYAISDMYLPKDVISEILKNCGYELDGIYVSSEVGLTKSTGNLFKYFLSKENLLPNDVLHIGDNKHADDEGSSIAGIRSVIISKDKNMLTYLNKTSDIALKGFVNHGINKIIDREEQIGYEVLGPIIVAFCQWIHNRYLEFEFNKLFFLSRDMHIVFDIYKKIYANDNIEYMYVSRKSLHSALNNDDGLRNYLKSIDFKGNIAVIDTGWRCAAQPILEYYARKNVDTTNVGGLYFGVKTGYRYINRCSKSSACFYSSKLDMIKSQTYSSLIESFLGYNENKVIGYKADGTPVFNIEKKNNECMAKIQKGAIIFAENWLIEKGNASISTKDIIKAYKEIQDRPLLSDINIIGDSEYDDVETTKIVSYEKTGNIKKWLNNLRFSAWKGAYFKKSFKCYTPFYYGYLVLDSIYLSYLDKKVFYGKNTEDLLLYYK